jgi:iron complex transport system permease protein
MLRGKGQKTSGMALVAIIALAAAFAGCAAGSADISVGDVFRVLFWHMGIGSAPDVATDTIVWSLRLPRIVLAALAGASLGMGGAAMQGLFRNALADPALIGVSGGGALGAVGAAVLGGSVAVMPPAAILGAFFTTALVYNIARVGARVESQTMLLAGLAVNALAGALVGFLIQIAPYEEVRSVLFWLLGSMSGATWKICGVAFLFSVVPLAWMPRQSRALNAMLLGDAEAYHLGYDVQRVKLLCVVLTAMMVGVSVAFCGAIGFVGLVVPHLSRMIFGPDHRILLPSSALLGAMLLILADVGARTLDAPAELPVGVLTALLGAPFFLYLIYRRKGAADRR